MYFRFFHLLIRCGIISSIAFGLGGCSRTVVTRSAAKAGDSTPYEIPPPGPVTPTPGSQEPFAIALQTIPPRTEASIIDGAFNQAQMITLKCTDLIACKRIAFTKDGSEPDFSGRGTAVVTPGDRVTTYLGEGSDGKYTLKFRAENAANVLEEVKSVSIEISRQSPATNTNLSAGVYHEPITVRLTCSGPHGCAQLSYTINGGDPNFSGNGTVVNGNAYNLPAFQANGEFLVAFRARDSLGNIEPVRIRNYVIALPCTGNTISKTGYGACTRVCGSYDFEGAPNQEHTECQCRPTHAWHSFTQRCSLNSGHLLIN